MFKIAFSEHELSLLQLLVHPHWPATLLKVKPVVGTTTSVQYAQARLAKQAV